MDNRPCAVLFGAGKICRDYVVHLSKDYRIVSIIDRNPNLWGTSIFDIPVISIDKYVEKFYGTEIFLTLNFEYVKQAEAILKEKQITNYSLYTKVLNPYLRSERESIVSYSDKSQLEDIILYNALYDQDDIFYIDVGSCDPFYDSVTKLLYDVKHASGINIEPQQEFYEMTKSERPRDINIRCAVSNKEGSAVFYEQGGRSTLLKDNVIPAFLDNTTTINITTLKKICDKYIDEKRDISFLKIDVEGKEREVLEGADFIKYRPYIIVIEATLPNTNIPCHEMWEDLLINAHYHFVYSYGVNRYYVADEKSELDDKFIPMIDIMRRFHIISVR